MATKFSPSVNIIRDADKQVGYILTPNAEKVALQISKDYQKGIHAFTIIGSYGTGKSSFLMALDHSLKGDGIFDTDLGFTAKKIETIRVVGQYQSLVQYFEESFEIADDFDGHQKIFDCLHELTRKNDLVVIYLDEFGKFLEFASKTNPERELYFLQLLAEFVNDHNREILLISTLHQNFEAYAGHMASETQKKEWRKVKGRFRELTFNEPVEQLLFLAAKKLEGGKRKGRSKIDVAQKHSVLPFSSNALSTLDTELAPLDIVSASVLTKALQKYGQNERSLFTFLESDLKDEEEVSVVEIFDYLYASFYSQLNSSYNPDYRNWQTIQAGIERIENGKFENADVSIVLFKTIGLLQLFGSKSAQIDIEFLTEYYGERFLYKEIKDAIKELEKKSLIRFANYNKSFKLIEGTDVDFDLELQQAEEAVDRSFDIISALEEHFEFPIIQAKEVSYRTGTPRLFGFEISQKPKPDLKPSGPIDGYVNLIFNETLQNGELKKQSAATEEAIIFGYFTNSKTIQDHIFDILKTKKVLVDNQEDLVAKSEFKKIIAAHERLLYHEVMGSLYSDKVRWFYNGKELAQIDSQKKLNAQLSHIAKEVYYKCPIFDNELMNKHKISTSIHTARKNFFERLAEHWMEKDLGFDAERFPPEKSIYKSLLLDNEMHGKQGGQWDLCAPSSKNGFDAVWEASQEFLVSSRNERKDLIELWETLSQKPFKLKLGLIDFWIPTFLFINRGDFALYEGDKFIPYINDSVLYMVARNPDKYQVKAFEISGLRLKVFNKYREFLNQQKQESMSQEGFIESVRPFLVFYKDLNSYSKKTNRITPEARALREAIVNAQDPEKTFFEVIPKALKIDLNESASSDEVLSKFAAKLNDAVDDLKSAYSELLNRFETFICDEIMDKKVDFEVYKKQLGKRYKGIKEHRLLPKQKVFIARLNSPLNDRDSWLASIAQSLIGKPLDQIEDKEEDILKDRMLHMIKELDNLLALHQLKTKEGEQVFKLDITSSEGTRSQNVRLPKDKVKKVDAACDEINELLKQNKSLRLAILSRLIQNELDQ